MLQARLLVAVTLCTAALVAAQAPAPASELLGPIPTHAVYFGAEPGEGAGKAAIAPNVAVVGAPLLNATETALTAEECSALCRELEASACNWFTWCGTEVRQHPVEGCGCARSSSWCTVLLNSAHVAVSRRTPCAGRLRRRRRRYAALPAMHHAGREPLAASAGAQRANSACHVRCGPRAAMCQRRPTSGVEGAAHHACHTRVRPVSPAGRLAAVHGHACRAAGEFLSKPHASSLCRRSPACAGFPLRPWFDARGVALTQLPGQGMSGGDFPCAGSLAPGACQLAHVDEGIALCTILLPTCKSVVLFRNGTTVLKSVLPGEGGWFAPQVSTLYS